MRQTEFHPGIRCDNDGCPGVTFVRWAQDERYLECARCHHVCAHKGSPMAEPQPLRMEQDR